MSAGNGDCLFRRRAAPGEPACKSWTRCARTLEQRACHGRSQPGILRTAWCIWRVWSFLPPTPPTVRRAAHWRYGQRHPRSVPNGTSCIPSGSPEDQRRYPTALAGAGKPGTGGARHDAVGDGCQTPSPACWLEPGADRDPVFLAQARSGRQAEKVQTKPARSVESTGVRARADFPLDVQQSACMSISQLLECFFISPDTYLRLQLSASPARPLSTWPEQKRWRVAWRITAISTSWRNGERRWTNGHDAGGVCPVNCQTSAMRKRLSWRRMCPNRSPRPARGVRHHNMKFMPNGGGDAGYIWTAND